MTILEIDINEKDAEGAIIKAVKEEINRILSKASTNIKLNIRKAVQSAIMNSKVYKSLVNHGQLQGELGVVNPGTAMTDILNVWIKSIKINLKPARTSGNNSIKASIDIDMINNNYQDVLSLQSAKYTTDKGEEIPWLEWLLTAGDKIIIRNYDIVFNAKYSRTGLNIMLKSVTANWRVPPEFSGTPNNNFVTRALESIEDVIASIIEDEIIKVF